MNYDVVTNCTRNACKCNIYNPKYNPFSGKYPKTRDIRAALVIYGRVRDDKPKPKMNFLYKAYFCTLAKMVGVKLKDPFGKLN